MNENLTFVEWWFQSKSVFIGDNLHLHLQDDEALESIWKNPYQCLQQVGLFTKNNILDCYEQHVRRTLWEELDSLAGCELGCFCYPSQRCHGDVLIKLYTEKMNMIRQKASNSLQCVICLTNPRDTIMDPCMHLCICQDCSKHLMEKRMRKCPICRKSVVMKKIYIS